MASLRRKPQADVVAASVDTEKPVAIGIDSNTPPAPTPSPEPSSAAEQALLVQLNSLRESEKLQHAHQQQAQAIASAESRRKDWLKSNPLAQKHYGALGNLHREALEAGNVDTSDGYFSFLNDRLDALHTEHPSAAGEHLIEEMQQRTAHDATAEREKQAVERAQLERRPGYIVSAPVSREIPSASGGRNNGKITLTVEQKEFARIAGVTETEYARQLMKMNEMKASGEYSEQR